MEFKNLYPTYKDIPELADFPVPDPEMLRAERLEYWNYCKQETKNDRWKSPRELWNKRPNIYIRFNNCESIDFGYNQNLAARFIQHCKALGLETKWNAEIPPIPV